MRAGKYEMQTKPRRCSGSRGRYQNTTRVLLTTSSPTQEFLGAGLRTYSGAETQLCPIKVPVNGCLWEIPAAQTWANRPNFLQWPYDAGEQN